MNIPDDPRQIRRMLDSRLRELRPRGPLLTATVAQSGRTCGRPGCRCYRGDKHISTRVTFKKDGKTRSAYVPVELMDEVTQWATEGHRLRRLMKEANELAIVLIRAHARGKKRRHPK